MIVSTKGRYALRVMVGLAMGDRERYIPLKEIAETEGISQKYLESIMTVLSKAGFVDAVHGKGGGYRLNRPAADYTVGAISCTAQGPVACNRSTCCQTKPMWDRLDSMIDGFFESITLQDLLNENK